MGERPIPYICKETLIVLLGKRLHGSPQEENTPVSNNDNALLLFL